MIKYVKRVGKGSDSKSIIVAIHADGKADLFFYRSLPDKIVADPIKLREHLEKREWDCSRGELTIKRNLSFASLIKEWEFVEAYMKTVESAYKLEERVSLTSFLTMVSGTLFQIEHEKSRFSISAETLESFLMDNGFKK
jgi:hypothetical protein